jgi:CelD/BcsL family acetyltransferase involved in cellulose biosynthesis
MSFSKDWDFLDFQEIPGHSGTAETIEKWSNSRKLKSISIFRDKSFFMDLNSNADFFLKKVSKKLNTKMKKLNKNMRGHLEFRRYEHQEPKENFFSDIQSIAKLSWKAEKQRSIFLKEKIRDFHKELFSKFAESGHLDVSILRLDNMPIAYMYNFLYNNRLYNYSIEFNKKYSHVSPGSMLMLWLIKDSIQKGIREIDFGRGEEEWKKRLTRDCRIHAKVMIFNRTFYGRFLYLLYSGIEFIKSRRIIYAILRRLKQRFV